MSALDIIETQPKFPVVDLSDKNAEATVLALSNKTLLDNFHRLADRVYGIFRVTHPALLDAAGNILPDVTDKRSVNFGIRAFEAATFMVSADVPTVDDESLRRNVQGVVDPRNLSGVIDYFEESHAKLLVETPSLAEVVSEAASRYQFDPRLAAFGAGVARMFELHNVEHIEA